MSDTELHEELSKLRGEVYKLKVEFDNIIAIEDNESTYMNKISQIIKNIRSLNTEIKNIESLVFKNRY